MDSSIHDAIIIAVTVLATLGAAVWIRPRLEKWRAARSDTQAAQLAARDRALRRRARSVQLDPKSFEHYRWRTLMLAVEGLLVLGVTIVTLLVGAAAAFGLVLTEYADDRTATQLIESIVVVAFLGVGVLVAIVLGVVIDDTHRAVVLSRLVRGPEIDDVTDTEKGTPGEAGAPANGGP